MPSATNALSFSLEDPALRSVLLSGVANGRHAVPFALRESNGQSMLEFELVSPDRLGRPSGLKVWLKAARLMSLTATLMPCLSVMAYGFYRGWQWHPLEAICAVAGAVVLQLSVNLWNDAEDYLRLIDLPGTLGGAGVIQRGWLSAQTVRRAAIALLGLGILLGLPALRVAPQMLWLVGAIAVIGTAGYSGWPFGFKYRALGDFTVFLLCGPGLTLGASWAAFGVADAGIVGLGLFFGLAAVAILHANNMQDVDVDARRGAITFAQNLGPQKSRAYLVLLYAAAQICILVAVVARILPAHCLLTLAVAPLWLRFVASVARAKTLEGPKFRLMRVTAAQLHLALGASVLLSLALAV